MRRNYMKLLAIAAVVLAAGCAENAVDGVNPFEGAADGYTLSVGGEKARENGGEKDAAPGAGEEKASTRAELGGDGIYRWSPADRVGMFVAPAGGTTPILDNVRLTGINAGPITRTDFEGELTRDQIEQFTEDATYDYYSYYPYDASVGSSGMPKVTISLPAVRSVSPDVFGPGCLMVAHATGKGPITWLDGGGQRFGEKISFSYRHVFSYLEVYLALNLMSQPVGKIVITSLDGPIAGTANIDLTTGAVNFSSEASNSITVNIGGEGLDIRSATDYGRIWIPIDPALSGKQFKLDFYSAVDERNVYSTTVSGKPLQAGMKHKVGFRLPFYINFSDLADRDSGWSSDGWNNISHRGYDFRRWNVNPGSNFVGKPFDDGHLTFDADNGVVYTPAIETVNSLGLSGVNVRVSFVAAGNDVLWWPFNNGNKMRYGITAMDSEVFMGEVKMNSGSNIQEHSFTGTLTAEKPHVIFKANLWGEYFAYMEQIKIEYIP